MNKSKPTAVNVDEIFGLVFFEDGSVFELPAYIQIGRKRQDGQYRVARREVWHLTNRGVLLPESFTLEQLKDGVALCLRPS